MWLYGDANMPSPCPSDIPSDKIRERVQRKYDPSPSPQPLRTTQRRDVIVVGGGHNGLIAAAYLAKQGLDVLVLERRHVLGGAAVTEELMPGFKFSRVRPAGDGWEATFTCSDTLLLLLLCVCVCMCVTLSGLLPGRLAAAADH